MTTVDLMAALRESLAAARTAREESSVSKLVPALSLADLRAVECSVCAALVNWQADCGCSPVPVLCRQHAPEHRQRVHGASSWGSRG